MKSLNEINENQIEPTHMSQWTNDDEFAYNGDLQTLFLGDTGMQLTDYRFICTYFATLRDKVKVLFTFMILYLFQFISSSLSVHIFF